MAQQALPPGTIQRRTFFGLLDADGWPAAFWKALFWFILILFMLGYLPDRAYYFTVEPALDVGENVFSPVNFCDGGNESLPCPAPRGAMIPWQTSPAALALPAPRAQAGTFQSGTQLFVVGGLVDGKPTDSVLVTTTTPDGNFGAWQNGPSLPAPRTDFAIASFNGTPYVIGGLDADGKPTSTVFVGDIQSGNLAGWKADDTLALPTAVSGAAAVSTGTGLWLIGGKTAAGLSATALPRRPGQHGQAGRPAAVHRSSPPWSCATAAATRPRGSTPRPSPRAARSSSSAARARRARPISSSCSTLNAIGEPSVDGQGRVIGWGQSVGASSLPAPRTQFGGFVANGALYVPGGFGADGKPTSTVYWTVPDATTGQISQWNHLDQTDLAQPVAEASSAVAGSFALVIGGQGDDRRADRLVPREPGARRAVLPPRPHRRDHPRAVGQGRRRRAAGLRHGRHRGRHQLHHPDRHRRAVHPAGDEPTAAGTAQSRPLPRPARGRVLRRLTRGASGVRGRSAQSAAEAPAP